ncbi:SDR family oxidoreductase [Gordonia sp. 'Campus']|uniref:SDR family NAD(P)-dependent oxidoreductase n=1 Tax=Gordonia sp. 'Campus' TaxID=2915824 RepID=UPI001EE420AD|nr:SDR family NAD(P)-dependent oxidoreductase [Gordonia sp. 'Campus']
MAEENVQGSTIVIAGASSGFGRGAAVRLGELGANVVVAARRGEVLDEVVGEITGKGGSAIAVTTDVSDPRAVSHLAAAALEHFGAIDVWVNNVGVGTVGYFWDIPVEDHARIVDVNLKGLIYGAHAALRVFRAQGRGTLVNVGSVDSEVPLALQNTYAATKAAVRSLGHSLTEELRMSGDDAIRVGTILPWAVDTPWWTHAANYTGHEPRMAAMDDPQIVVDAIVAACTDPKLDQPVGYKAKAASASHTVMPGITERFSAAVVKSETEKGAPVKAHSGAIHDPNPDSTGVSGGIRERMVAEDAR